MSEANHGAQKIRVGVFGAGGRMGATVCDAVMADPDLELVAAVDPACAGTVIHGITIGADPRAMADAGVQVAVDFTIAAASRTNLQWCALHGVHAVVGTTGFSDADLAGFRSAFTSSNCMIAANFAISAVLMMKFAEMASPWFETAEIIELHHDQKADAPSGTAVATANRMAAASSEWAADPTTHEVIAGARGGKGPSRYSFARGSYARHGCASRSDLGFGWANIDHSPRQLRPRELYAGRGVGLQKDCWPTGSHHGPRTRPRFVNRV